MVALPLALKLRESDQQSEAKGTGSRWGSQEAKPHGEGQGGGSPWMGTRGTQPSGPRSDWVLLKSVFSLLLIF